MGRPAFEPTDEQRHHVELLAGMGIPQDEIRLLVENPATGDPIDRKTLAKHFERELSVGAAKANSAVAQSLYRKALGNSPQAVTAAIWWTKCRMGWRERVEHEVDVRSGVLVPPAPLSPEEWISAAARSRSNGDDVD